MARYRFRLLGRMAPCDDSWCLGLRTRRCSFVIPPTPNIFSAAAKKDSMSCCPLKLPTGGRSSGRGRPRCIIVAGEVSDAGNLEPNLVGKNPATCVFRSHTRRRFTCVSGGAHVSFPVTLCYLQDSKSGCRLGETQVGMHGYVHALPPCVSPICAFVGHGGGRYTECECSMPGPTSKRFELKASA